MEACIICKETLPEMPRVELDRLRAGSSATFMCGPCLKAWRDSQGRGALDNVPPPADGD